MTQGPEDQGAVALLLPAAVTTLSSARSPSGEVMIRKLYPLPTPDRPYRVGAKDQMIRWRCQICGSRQDLQVITNNLAAGRNTMTN